MWSLLLLAGCLVNTDLYDARTAALADGDGDGWSIADGDCADDDPAVHPGADERCDGRDDDCDGRVDDDPVDATVWYADGDGDGYGDPARPADACDAPAGHVANAGDCDDAEALAWADAAEVPYDGVDNDCVEGDLVDVDGDGHAATATGGGDCDDDDPAVFPGADETWANGVTDNDCDGEREPLSETFGADALTGTEPGGQFGRRLAPLGDVDGDGIAEFLVGAVYEDADADYGGAVYLVNGVDGTTAADFPRLGGTSAYGFLGTVAGGPDVDGDGAPDLLAAGTGADGGRGTVWLVSGADFAAIDDAAIASVATVTLTGSGPDTFLGSSVAFLGDLDGDGVEDLGAGAPYTSPDGDTHAGTVGIWQADTLRDGTLDDADWLLHGARPGSTFGQRLESAGDLDADGYLDVLVGGTGELATVLPGGSTAPTTDDALFTLEGHLEDEVCAPRMLGDVDGDGARDLGCAHLRGDALLFTALMATPNRSTNSPTWTVDLPEDSYMFDLVDLGDLDGDGRSETLIPPQNHGEFITAVAAVLFGDGITFGGSVAFDSLPLRVRSVRPYGAYGYRVALSDDTNGDGVRDLIFGGYADAEGGDEAGGVVLLPVPH